MLLVLASLLAFASLAKAADPSSATGQSAFPLPLAEYHDEQMNNAISQLIHRVQLEPFNLIATLIFFCAIIHTFLTPTFTKIARRYEREFDALEVYELDSEIGKAVARRRDKLQFRAQFSSFLGEVEAVFGVWLVPLFLGIIIMKGWPALVTYSTSISPAEPIFVVAIMAMASSRPILTIAERGLATLAGIGGYGPAAWWITILSVDPCWAPLLPNRAP